MKHVRSYLAILGIFLVGTLIILPKVQITSANTYFEVLLLHYNKFDQWHLNKLSIEYPILFMLLIQVVFSQNISIVAENNSYSSMYLHKTGKRRFIESVVLENTKMIVCLYSFTSLCVLLITLIISLVLKVPIDGQVLFHIVIYIARLYGIIAFILIFYQLRSVMKEISYFSVLVNFTIPILLLNDALLGTSIISMGESIKSEMIYLFVVFLLLSLALRIFIHILFKSKEVYQ